MRDRPHTLCRMMAAERKCTQGAVRLCSALEKQVHTGFSSSDVWYRTASFFSVKKTFILHKGYSETSRDAMRRLPSPAEDLTPLFCQP